MTHEEVSDAGLRSIIASVLETGPEEWGDADTRVLFARARRLQERIEELEAHHRVQHPRCRHLQAAAGDASYDASAHAGHIVPRAA